MSSTPQTVVAVTSGGYWGKGEDLEAAISKCYAEGARGTQDVVIYIYTGSNMLLKEVQVSGAGDIFFPSQVTSNRVGKVRMPMKQTNKKGKK